jgi:hypothetical protein
MRAAKTRGRHHLASPPRQRSAADGRQHAWATLGGTIWSRRRADEAPLPRAPEDRRTRGVHQAAAGEQPLSNAGAFLSTQHVPPLPPLQPPQPAVVAAPAAPAAPAAEAPFGAPLS